MIEIEEPPDIRACAAFQVPLVWLWSPTARKWKSYEPVDPADDVIRRHRCEHHSQPDPSWRQLEFNEEPDPVAAERAHAGAARVREQLERAQREGDPS